MEVLIAGAIASTGYLLTNTLRNQKQKALAEPTKKGPESTNIFNSNRVQKIRLSEQKISDAQFKEVFGAANKANRVFTGPPTPYFNKVDFVEKELPLEFRDNPPRLDSNGKEYDVGRREYGDHHPTGKPVAGGYYGISLTGEPIDPKNFTHNNMQPFFGSHVRQNLDEYGNRRVIENFTGNKYFTKKKTEIPQLFNPESNISNPYGASNLSGYQRERYVVSNRRNNEAPTEKIYVGPGLNRGYTWKPSGGYQQNESRDYRLPKTVDELRVKTNPKLVYNLPVIPGSKPSRPGKVGVVQKNRPDKFAVWSPDRYFVTTGDRLKPKQRPEMVLKHVNRATTSVRQSIGPAGPREGFSQQGIRANVRMSEKCQYTRGGVRNASASGQWAIPEECPVEPNNYVPMEKCENSSFPLINAQTSGRNHDAFVHDKRTGGRSVHDYGRGGIHLPKNVREGTQCLPSANIVGSNKGHVAVTDNLRHTRKQNIIGNTRWASNVQSSAQAGVVWDPENTLKTTVKETTLSHGRIGGAHNGEHLRPQIYDKDTAPKVTHKETTLTEYSGNAYRPVEDGRDSNCYEAKNTKRQFTSNHSYVGNAGNDVPNPRETKCMLDNATTRSHREVISKGRYPAREGPKEALDVGWVNAKTNRRGDLQNRSLSRRMRMNTKVYNSLPQANPCSRTKHKKTVSNKELRYRLDPNNLSPFRQNPYTQTLSSYWTY